MISKLPNLPKIAQISGTVLKTEPPQKFITKDFERRIDRNWMCISSLIFETAKELTLDTTLTFTSTY